MALFPPHFCFVNVFISKKRWRQMEGKGRHREEGGTERMDVR